MPRRVPSKPSALKPDGVFSQAWQCHHYKTHSEITAYVEANAKWEVVAVIRSTAGVSAETLASFITHLANEHRHGTNLLQGAKEALESILNDGLDFTTEQSADRMVGKIKKAGL